jgi:hypothetical protein
MLLEQRGQVGVVPELAVDGWQHGVLDAGAGGHGTRVEAAPHPLPDLVERVPFE